MDRRHKLSAGLFLSLCVLVMFHEACKDAKQNGSQGNTGSALPSAMASRYSFQAHLTQGSQAFDVLTEGSGSLRALSIVRKYDGVADTIEEEIDGSVVSAACADLDRDSIPEIYVFAQSSGSGSYANLYGFEFDRRGRRSIVLPELDKRQAAGYLGHDTLWVQDTVLARRFPIFTEGDFNASASGGTRTLEYVLQRDRTGTPYLQCIRIVNNQ